VLSVHGIDQVAPPERYRIVRRLGSGGAGVVYAAFDIERGQTVALKTLLRADPATVYRFKKEFRTLSDVAHPNLVSLYDLVVDAPYCFFTMELIDGVDFFKYVRPSPAHLDEARLRGALAQLVEGVRVLHDAGIAHRDIKPSNVLVDTAGRVAVLDFGLALNSTLSTTETEGRLSGTVAYMAPEQAAGHRGGAASDCYSVGVMLYQALTGQLPHTGSVYEVLVAKQSQNPVSPLDGNPDLPSDLVAVCMRLLALNPDDRPRSGEVVRLLGGTPAARPSRLRDAAPLVGREHELDALNAAFERCRDGHSITVYVHGPSGMGKTALIAHLLDAHESRADAGILSGRCYERESMPYKALDGVVDDLMRHLGRLTDEDVEQIVPLDRLASLTRSFPVLLEVPCIRRLAEGSADVEDPITMRRRGLQALKELLRRIAARRTLIVHVDDLHWCDADGTTPLTDLSAPPAIAGLLLIVTFRSEEIESKPFLRDLLHGVDGERIREIYLGPLADDQARRLVRSLLPGGSTDGVVTTIVREAAGSPFFLDQLIRYAMEHDSAASTGITLAEMLEARLASLPAGSGEMMNVLAVARHPLDARAAYTAAGLSGDERPLIAALRFACFVRSAGDAAVAEVYHDRIRDVLVTALGRDGAQAIHGRIAQALTDRRIDDPEILFEHYLCAHEWTLAGVQAAAAAARSAAAFAFERAAAFYRYALKLGSHDASERSQLSALLATALSNAGRTAESADAYLAAANDAASASAALELRRHAAEQFLVGGHVDRGLDTIASVLSAVGLRLAGGPKRALLSLLVRRAELLVRGLSFEQRSEREIGEETLTRIDTCWAVATGLAVIDNIRAADFQTRHLLMALKAGEPYRIARSLSIEAVTAAATGGVRNQRRADRLIRSSETIGKTLDNPHTDGLLILARGAAAYFRGQWKLAFQLGEHGEQTLRRHGVGTTWELSSAQNFVIGSLMYLGELHEVRRRLPVLLEDAMDRANLYAEVHLRTRQNLMYLVADDPDGARADIDDAMGRWSHRGYHVQHYLALLARTQIELYAGRAEAAWNLVESGWPDLQRSLLLRVQVVRIEASYLRARCALAAQKPGADRLAASLAREGVAWAEPLAEVIRAGCEQADRRSHLMAAAAGFDKADMALHAAAVRSVASPETGSEIKEVVNPGRFARMLVGG
jgi:eukaryotic-like serine/threonine-protein kinase